MAKERPYNALFDKLPDVISKNERAGEIMGMRNLHGAIPIDIPAELGYHCPVCKYPMTTDGNFDERVMWGEYNGFMYCAVCNKDYPAPICMPDIDRAIGIFLDIFAAKTIPWWKRMDRSDISAELSATFDIGLQLAGEIADWILKDG